MPFQSTIPRYDIASGIPGEVAFDGPQRAEPGILNSADPANNVFGRVMSLDGAAPSVWRAGDVADNGERFGILANPKEHVSYGSAAGGPTAPQFVLPNGVIGTIFTMGILWGVTTVAGAKVGDIVRFVKATGELLTVPPGTAANAAHKDLPGASVVRYPQPNAGGLIVVQLTQ